MQKFSNFENFQFVKNTKFSKFSQNLSFYYRDLRPKKKLLQFTQRIAKKFLSGIGEPMVPTFGGLANIDPKVKLRFEVLFKRFHPRINLTTLFLAKIYLLNTIKLFSDHENRSLATLRNLNFKIVLSARKLKFCLQASFEPTWCTSHSEF
jgi:hypothetical protein